LCGPDCSRRQLPSIIVFDGSCPDLQNDGRQESAFQPYLRKHFRYLPGAVSYVRHCAHRCSPLVIRQYDHWVFCVFRQFDHADDGIFLAAALFITFEARGPCASFTLRYICDYSRLALNLTDSYGWHSAPTFTAADERGPRPSTLANSRYQISPADLGSPSVNLPRNVDAVRAFDRAFSITGSYLPIELRFHVAVSRFLQCDYSAIWPAEAFDIIRAGGATDTVHLYPGTEYLDCDGGAGQNTALFLITTCRRDRHLCHTSDHDLR